MASTEHFDELEHRLSELVKDAVQQVKDELKEKLKSTREQVEEIIGKELNSAREAAASAEAEVAQTTEAVAAAEQQAYEAAEALAAAESRMAEMAEALEAAEGRAAESGGSLEAVEARAAEVSAALEAADTRAAEAAEAHDARQARVNELAESLEAAEGRITELSEALNNAEAATAEAVETLAAAPQVDLLSRVMEALSEVDQGRTQAEVLQGLLSGAGDFSSRVALFLTDPAGLRGWGHRGFGAGATEFDEIVIDYAEGTAQSRLAAGRGVIELSDEDCVAICTQIDGSRPRSGVLIPLVLANRLAAALYADQLDDSPIEMSALQLLAYLAGQALETLPLREGGSAVTLQFESEAAEDAGLELWDFTPPVPEMPDTIEEDSVDLEAAQDSEAVEESVYSPEPTGYQPAEDSGFAVEMADQVAMDSTAALVDEEPVAVEPMAVEEAYVEEAEEEAVEEEEYAAEAVEEAVEEVVEEEAEIEAAAVEEISVEEAAVEEPEEITPAEATEVAPPPASAGPLVAPPEDLEGPGWAFQTRTLGGEGDEDSTHEEARRLARLLVTEIKLYNEEQVEEGRRNRDIYQTLREDIDRSRQIYEERVDEGVRTGTDYFHDELVRILAAGESDVLGV